LPVKRSHRSAALMAGSARNRIWHLLTSAVDVATRLLPAFGSRFFVDTSSVSVLMNHVTEIVAAGCVFVTVCAAGRLHGC